MSKFTKFLLLGMCLMVALAGCSSNSDSPEKAAKDWLQAFADGEGLAWDQLTCDAQKEQTNDQGFNFTFWDSILGAVAGQGVEIDVSDVGTKTIKHNDRSALVHVTGKMRTALGLSVESENLDEDWIMIKEDEQWKYCGTTTLSTRDPRLLILQVDEVPIANLKMSQTSDNVGQAISDGFITEDEANSLMAIALRVYEGDDDILGCAAMVFSDSDAAAKQLSSVVADNDEIEIINGLGDEAFVHTYRFDDGLEGSLTGFEYTVSWRTDNIVFFLSLQSFSGQISMADARKLADTMQSRLD